MRLCFTVDSNVVEKHDDDSQASRQCPVDDQQMKTALNENSWMDLNKNSGRNRSEKSNGYHRWHLARHLVRSGLLFQQSRRASDSLLPLLRKTERKQLDRTDSIDSDHLSPFQSLVNYLSLDEKKSEAESQENFIPNRIKRTRSEQIDCMRRNTLDDAIIQYEQILKHLKNHSQFMSEYPVQSASELSSENRRTSVDQPTATLVRENSSNNTRSHTLAHRLNATFSQFIIDDLFSCSVNNGVDKPNHLIPSISISSETSSKHEGFIYSPTEIRVNDQSRQNDSVEVQQIDIALNELDAVIGQESERNANIPVNVIVINASQLTESYQVNKMLTS